MSNVTDVLGPPLAAGSAAAASAVNATAVAAMVSLLNGSASANATAVALPTTLSPKQAAGLALLEYLHKKYLILQIVQVVGYGNMFLLCTALLTYLRLNRNAAFKGDASAARKVILPAFEPLLIVLAVTTGLYTLFFTFALYFGWYAKDIPKISTEIFYCGRQFVFLNVVVFMLQRSISGRALRRSLLVTFCCATYTIPIVWYMVHYGNPEHFYWVMTPARACMLLIYTYIFIRPPGRASKRTIREYCVFTYFYYALYFTYNELFRQGSLDWGFALTYATLITGSFVPLVIWRVLKADTEHWRGMGQRACALQCLFRQRNQLPERVSSKGLHVLIEMHRKYIIDFAHLQLKQRIGVGASAVVFNGILRSKLPVAVKVYTPHDFTEETVAEFSQEAALCGALHHPNVVTFYGMCVAPPTICLVSELCQGSLEDVICAQSRRNHHHTRQQLLIDVAYMVDAARAVAYIHSFTPSLLHRDLKPANFLVDAENNVKLTDFGESRSLPRQNISSQSTGHREELATRRSVATLEHIEGPSESDGVRLTMKGTVDYMAPEVINGKAGMATYGESADIYSLGITMWDILNPGREKFPTIRGNHFKVFEFVTEGQRPELDARLHPQLREVIKSAWQPDPRARPSALNMVSMLETIQAEVAAAFAMEMQDGLESDSMTGKSGLMDQSFTGEQAVELMESAQYVSCVSEAIRLGNALMDSGMLHHAKHSQPFENTNSMYYFDDYNITMSQPLSAGAYDGAPAPGGKYLHDATEDTMSTVSGSTRHSRSSYHSHMTHNKTHAGSSNSEKMDNGMCACSKLGQRLTMPKMSARRRFRRNKVKAILEEPGLQGMQASLLLHDDDQASELQSPTFHDFHTFDGVGSGAAA